MVPRPFDARAAAQVADRPHHEEQEQSVTGLSESGQSLVGEQSSAQTLQCQAAACQVAGGSEWLSTMLSREVHQVPHVRILNELRNQVLSDDQQTENHGQVACSARARASAPCDGVYRKASDSPTSQAAKKAKRVMSTAVRTLWSTCVDRRRERTGSRLTLRHRVDPDVHKLWYEEPDRESHCAIEPQRGFFQCPKKLNSLDQYPRRPEIRSSVESIVQIGGSV